MPAPSHRVRTLAATLLLCAAIGVRVFVAGGLVQVPASAPPVDFLRDIQPILQASCAKCHGPEKARGGLRLDDRAAALRGGDSGPAMVPGKSGDSLLVKRILGLIPGEDPMPKEGDPLTPAQIGLIRAWIDQGAPWPEAAPASATARAPSTDRQHWAYIKPVGATPPDVKNARWPRNAIDRFVLARLEKDGLAPSPEAPFETLVRRVSLDLTGLPPTIAELDAALDDAQKNGRDAAYERVVDRLLASPHYGERWARPWLDLARYADSHGYEKDRLRVMWKYRDWVIDALNADMPFDRFTIEQIAGDMLPDATDAQRIASGFHRNTMLNQEGGIDVEEARWETLVDRVNTTSTVWLGSTVGCAQCHDHKYDPFTQRDYYRMLAFFENVEYTIPQTGDRFANEPEINLPTAEQESRRKILQADLDKLNAELREETPARTAAQLKWEQSVLAADDAWTRVSVDQFTSSGNSTHQVLEDGSVLVGGANPGDNIYTVVAKAPIGGIRGIRIEALPDPRLPGGGPGRDRYGNFVLNGFEIAVGDATPVRLKADTTPDGNPVRLKADTTPDGNPDRRKADTTTARVVSGFSRTVALASAKVDDASANLDSFRQTVEGTSYAPRGWVIDATRDPDSGRLRRQVVFVAQDPFGVVGAPLTISLRHVGRPVGQSLGRFRISVTSSTTPLKIVEVPARQRAALLLPRAKRSEQQQRDLATLFRNVSPAFKPTRDKIASLQTALRNLGIVTALVMKEKTAHERPSTFIRRRGNFLDTGVKVFADVPPVLHRMRDDVMPNRLGLARWLVDPENPLTARVTVNRAWEQLFGRGLVETSEDFGVQGTPPSHPELLDWLAVTFMEQEWRVKPLHRAIVMSATYRQSSAMTPALIERDPYNRLFARGPRFRVEAEMVRDIALSAGGLLSGKIGGASVFPEQPDGIWQNPYSNDKWIESTGEDRYRRGLYTFIRRTAPYPAFMTFDATSREACTVRRVRTNTPLQALTLLNDEAFFEAARGLARRIMTEVPAEDASASARTRAAHGFRIVLARQPSDGELARLVQAFEQHLAHFRAHADRAQKVVGGVQIAGADAAVQAAWTMVANGLLNLDETITKE